MEFIKEIHIVSFNIPYPANYGGIIDVFYKLKTLYNLGIEINIHCYKYNKPESDELKKYCKSIHYYKRPISISYFLSTKPFIVISRSDKNLLKNLQKDSLPILFEGIHTTYFLKQLCKKQRQIIVRTHNIEHKYYNGLAKNERSIFKKLYFLFESIKLKRFENILNSDIKIAAISKNDFEYFKTINPNTFLIPAFHPFNRINIKPGVGDFILYHGDLSVNENIEAASFIIKNISPKIKFKFKLAGRNPDKKIIALIDKSKNIELIPNPSDDALNCLIRDAQINLLITFQNTGLKLKLINALYNGRHCLVNTNMVDGTQLESLCTIKDEIQNMVSEINLMINKPLNQNSIDYRNEIMLKIVNNVQNGQNLVNLFV